MHRSGTSATAGALTALGLHGPSGDDQAAPRQANERGYFESKQMMLLNRGLLANMGGTWSAPPRLAVGWENAPDLDEIRGRAALAFTRSFPVRPMVWKDPRNCITLPFWRRVVGLPQAAVFVYRDPLEVARSLQVRNDVGLTYGLALWDRYVRAACAGLTGLPTLVMDYADVLEQPVASIDALSDFLATVGVDVDGPTRRTAAASVDIGLRHHRGSATRSSGLWDSQFEVAASLGALRGVHASWRPPDIGPEPDWVDDILGLRLATDELRKELNRLGRGSRWRALAARIGGRSRR
jgi:hypothetical protein